MKKEPVTITVALTKGGVAKTTTATNLACQLGLNGKKTLFVDMDEQGNGTYSLTGQSRSTFNNSGAYDAFRTFGIPGLSTDAFIHETLCTHVDILPATDMQRQIPEQCALLTAQYPNCQPYCFLALLLQNIQQHSYDYIIVDTAPSKTALMLGGVYAADHLILPMHPDKYNIDGLQETYRLVETMNQESGSEIHILGILLTMVEKVNFTKMLREHLQNGEFSDTKFTTEIRKGQAVNDATFGRPVVVDNPHCKPAQDYAAFTREVVGRIRAFEKARLTASAQG